jgi:hypothetical protein
VFRICTETIFEVETKVHVSIDKARDQAPVGECVDFFITLVGEHVNVGNPLNSAVSNHYPSVINACAVTQ